MEFNIKEKKENSLLSRIELSIEIKHFGTANPSYANIAKEIANQLKTKEDLIVIKHVYPAFGEGKSDVTAYVYKNKEALEKTETHEMKKRAAADKKAAEAKKEEKPAEAPAKKEAAPAPAEKPAEPAKEAPAEEKAPEEKPVKEEKPEGEK